MQDTQLCRIQMLSQNLNKSLEWEPFLDHEMYKLVLVLWFGGAVFCLLFFKQNNKAQINMNNHHQQKPNTFGSSTSWFGKQKLFMGLEPLSYLQMVSVRKRSFQQLQIVTSED